MPNLAALRAAVFLPHAKNLIGGVTYAPPPPGRRLIMLAQRYSKKTPYPPLPIDPMNYQTQDLKTR